MAKRFFDFPRVAALIALCVLLGLTHLIVAQLQLRATMATRDRFDHFATATTSKIQTQLVRYVDILPGLRGLWNISGTPSRAVFHDYAKSLNVRERFPSLIQVNFCDYIEKSDTAAYEARVRKEDSDPHFHVFPSWTAHDHRLVVRRDDPDNGIYRGRDIEGNFRYDVATPTYTSSAPFTSGEAIKQLDGRKGAGLGIRLAFFQGGRTPSSSDREARFIGSGGLFVDVTTLINEAVPAQEWQFLALTLHTLPNAGEPAEPLRRQLFSFVPASGNAHDAISAQRTFTVAQRRFVLDFSVPAAYFDDPIGSHIELIGNVAGIAVSIAFALMLYQFLASHKQLTTTVTHQSQSLAHSEHRVERLLQERLQAEQEIARQGERQRQQIGRELHDDLGQRLTGASLLLGKLAHDSQNGARDDTRHAIEKISAIVVDSIDTIRSMSRGLAPFDGSPHDLGAALRELCAEIDPLLPDGCHLHNGFDTELLSQDESTHLYRIVQESMANALRHGHATRIDVSLSDNEGRVSLSVRDNGVGLPAGYDSDAPAASGLGLRNIRSRARLLGMHARIHRRPEGGTTVEVS
ncbi:ATP-binding protein [Paraburkholderia sp. J63]|uniref:ATP-binding protein n=1 Tax=Paraburkholderia sp. J63 TaxID=2805434 RepID=UPI002ABE8F70|nr:ATP-binding protein [Paraburkholderia sp. J63]